MLELLENGKKEIRGEKLLMSTYLCLVFFAVKEGEECSVLVSGLPQLSLLVALFSLFDGGLKKSMKKPAWEKERKSHKSFFSGNVISEREFFVGQSLFLFSIPANPR